MQKIKNNKKMLVFTIALLLLSTAFIPLVGSDSKNEPLIKPRPFLNFLGDFLQNLVDRFPFLGEIRIIQILLNFLNDGDLGSNPPTPPSGEVLPIPSGSIVPAVYEITTNKWVGGNPSGYAEGDTAAMGALMTVGSSGDGYWLVNLTMQVYESPFTNAYGFTNFEPFNNSYTPEFLFENNRHYNDIPIDFNGSEWNTSNPLIWFYNAKFVDMEPYPYEPTLGIGGFDNYIGVSVTFTKENDNDCWILFGGHLAQADDTLPAGAPEDPPSIENDLVDVGEGASAMTGVFQTRVGAGGDKTINFKPARIIEPNPCIDIEKTANVATAMIGQTIIYTYNVTNCGDTNLTSVTVVDDVFGAITLGTTTLAPGAYTTGTATYTVVEGDLPGPIVNVATVTGTTPTGGTVTDIDTVTVALTYTACISIDKEADVVNASVGQTITYTYNVTNCGDVTLTGVTVIDNILGTITLGTTTLAPGSSTTGTATHTVVEGDLPGPIINTATATGTTPVGGSVTDTDTESVSLIIAPCINIDKQANVGTASVGQTITYTYTVTNCGNVTLTDVTVVDDKLGSITLGITTLSPGASTTGTATHTVVEGDLPGPIVNTANATGTPPVGSDVTDTDNETVSLTYTACIQLDKQANVGSATVGQTITYTYNVTNCGNVNLTDVTVSDDVLGTITLGTTTLAPGAYTTGTATHTVVEGDLPGPIINNATATGTTPTGGTVFANDTESVTLTFTACIDIEKQANVGTASVGQTITYTYNVSNCGSVTLTSVTVVDDVLGSVTLGTTTLAPGAYTTGTKTYTVVEGDLPGPIVNTATATGTPPVGSDVTDTDNETVSLTYTACIQLDKQANVGTASVGQTITYTYNVSNCGDVTLTSVTVVDDVLGSVTLGTTTLAPGAYTTGTKTYTVVEGDLPGPIVNTATATGTPPVGSDVTDTDNETVSLTYCSCINIIKIANVATASIGQTITYTYNVTNCDSVTLTNVTVVDDVLGMITLGTTTLSPGSSTIGTATHTVVEGDLPGPIVNVATVTGITPTGGTITDNDTETVTLTYNPCINIDKEADVVNASVGQTITYTYNVSNCGDVTLTGVTVVDDVLGSVTLGTTTLAPGAYTTGTKTYNVVEGDLPGPIVNTATATGTDPIGGTVTDTDTETVLINMPCPPEVWIDDNWFNQAGVNNYNPSLIWGYNAFNDIQEGINVVCPCGTVHVRPGSYAGQFLINKSLVLQGEPGAKIYGSSLQTFTIDSSTNTYTPIIFAYAGTLIGDNVISSCNYISVKVDGFEIYGTAGTIAVLYHNVQNGCVPNQISNNKIYGVSIGVQLNGCTKNTLVIYNKMYWTGSGHTAVLLTPFVDCEPTVIIINYNYWGAPCSVNVGVENQGTEPVDARYNWWAEQDGPSSLDSNNPNLDTTTGRPANGLGDKVHMLLHQNTM